MAEIGFALLYLQSEEGASGVTHLKTELGTFSLFCKAVFKADQTRKEEKSDSEFSHGLRISDFKHHPLSNIL